MGVGVTALSVRFSAFEMASFWMSAALGAGVGLLYSVAGFLMGRIALLRPHLFMLFALGGMGVRMFLAACIVALVLGLSLADPLAFIGGFFLLFLTGLVIEIAAVLRFAADSSAPRFVTPPIPPSTSEAPRLADSTADSAEPRPAALSTDV